jgi:hypothetical protein
MRSSFQTSTGKLMLLVVVTAVELVLFQDVWFIVLIPPVTAMTLGINLGLWFVLVRPRRIEDRIIGMLLASVAAAILTAIYLTLGSRSVNTFVGYQHVGPIGTLLATTVATWAQSLAVQKGSVALILRSIASGAAIIEFLLLDLCTLGIIWIGGSLECRLRRQRRVAGTGSRAIAPPIDDRAATPL